MGPIDRPRERLGRRTLLGLAARSASAAVLGDRLRSGQASAASPIPVGVVEGQPSTDSLAAHASAKGLIYAAAITPGANVLSTYPDLAAGYATECGLVGSGNDFKWTTIHPASSRYNFAPGDAIAAFASANGQLLRGHTLVWHNEVPAWVPASITQENGVQILTSHIQTVVGHYAGQMHSWDAVNEAVNPGDGRPDGLRDTVWLRNLGPDYIDTAFRTAASADPQALLTYNDYGLEYAETSSSNKRAAVLALLKGMLARGVPVQALGVQSHLRASFSSADAASLVSYLNSVAGLGLKIFVTELDVDDKSLPADIGQRDAAVAASYQNYLTAVLSVPAVTLVMTWGLSDRTSWLLQFSPRPDGLPNRPLPLDANLARKPAWSAIAQALDGASGR
jgi:endo-1,4-beta-xylanase